MATVKTTSDEIGKARSKVSQLQADLETHRSNRQRLFQRSRLEEIALPLLDANAADPETAVGEAGEAASGGGKKKRKRGTAASPAAGPSSQELLASESFSPNGLVGTNTLDGVDAGEGSAEASSSLPPADEECVRLDFSQLDEGDRSGDSQQLDGEIAKEIEQLVREQEGMAPNMKAIQQYEDVSP